MLYKYRYSLGNVLETVYAFLLELIYRTLRWFAPWIHRPFDGRGLREVYVDGLKIPRPCYVNTLTGYVRYYGHELTIDRVKNEVITYEIHGKVVVKCLSP